MLTMLDLVSTNIITNKFYLYDMIRHCSIRWFKKYSIIEMIILFYCNQLFDATYIIY